MKRKAQEDKLGERQRARLAKQQADTKRAEQKAKISAEEKAAEAQARRDYEAARKREKEIKTAAKEEGASGLEACYQEVKHLKRKKDPMVNLLNPVHKT